MEGELLEMFSETPFDSFPSNCKQSCFFHCDSGSFPDLIFLEGVLAKGLPFFHDKGLFLLDIEYNFAFDDRIKSIGIFAPAKNDLILFVAEDQSVVGYLVFLLFCQEFEDSCVLDEPLRN